MFGISLFISVLIILDQASKWMVQRSIPLHHEIVVIKDFFSLTHVKNPGAAWGLLAMKSWGTLVLALISALLSFLLFVTLMKVRHKALRITLSFLVAGSVGNLIDRVFRGYVVDFLLFRFGGWAFPSFNLADSLIVCSSIFLFILLLKDSYFHDLIDALPIGKKQSTEK